MKSQNYKKMNLLECSLAEVEQKISVEQIRADRVQRVRESYKMRDLRLADYPLAFDPLQSAYYRKLKIERFMLKTQIFWLKFRLKLGWFRFIPFEAERTARLFCLNIARKAKIDLAPEIRYNYNHYENCFSLWLILADDQRNLGVY